MGSLFLFPNQYLSEAKIRAELDGTFTRIDRWNAYVTVPVPLDFVPTHEPRKKGGVECEEVEPLVERKTFRQRPDEAERRLIMKMRSEGASLRAIAAAVGRDYGVIGGWISRWKREGI